MKVRTCIYFNDHKEDVLVASTLIDVLYFIIKETYLSKDTICIANPTCVDNETLSDFLTYILAYPQNVKTPKVIVSNAVVTQPQISYEGFKGGKIICFSGGVDSTGAILKSIDDGIFPIALWCDYGQPYKNEEKKSVEAICRMLNIPLIEATLDISEFIAVGGARFGHIFPARNLLISAIGLCFKPSKLELAGLCDEMSVPDKSMRMYNEFGQYFGVPLTTPFGDKTKADVLCMWQKSWKKYLDANITTSCYGTNGECQNCSACAKREIAFVASGYHKNFPIVFVNQYELIERHWFSRIDLFQYKRRTDILISLNHFLGNLTSKLQRLVVTNCDKYKNEIERRWNELKREGGTIDELY